MLSCQMTMMIANYRRYRDDKQWRRVNVERRPKTKIMSGLAKSPDRVASLYAHPPRLLATSWQVGVGEVKKYRIFFLCHSQYLPCDFWQDWKIRPQRHLAYFFLFYLTSVLVTRRFCLLLSISFLYMGLHGFRQGRLNFIFSSIKWVKVIDFTKTAHIYF